MKPANYQDIARGFGFHCPQTLISAIYELALFSQTAAFQKSFPNGRLISSGEDIRIARLSGLPHHLLPFLQDKQPEHIDYYCVDLAGDETKKAVVVFALHAIVNEWENFEAFRIWLEQITAPSSYNAGVDPRA